MKELNAIYGSICLSDVPKDLFKKGKDGKVYLNLSVYPMKTEDVYGNQYTCSCAPKQEDRIEGVNYLIGKFKLIPKREDVAPTSPEEVSTLLPCNDDDLPF